ncbi:MAG: VOC family protein [Alphaproteobacteria bacterium]|nr:VOC family protein [Alphaproteobacteria bacterium]
MSNHHKINYIEIPASDLAATKAFFTRVFGWDFQDFGPDYAAFSGQGTDGGFYHSDLAASCATGSVLVVLYSDDLAATAAEVKAAGGKIIRDIFAFPGGRRFHFSEPSGNEFAVWSE